MSRPASAARLGSFNFPSVEYWWGVGVVGENYQEGLQKRRVKNVQYKEGLQLVLNNFFFGAIISLVSIVGRTMVKLTQCGAGVTGLYSKE